MPRTATSLAVMPPPQPPSHSKMNLKLSNARLVDGNGRLTHLASLHVMGRRVRAVHIPDEVRAVSGAGAASAS